MVFQFRFTDEGFQFREPGRELRRRGHDGRDTEAFRGWARRYDRAAASKNDDGLSC